MMMIMMKNYLHRLVAKDGIFFFVFVDWSHIESIEKKMDR